MTATGKDLLDAADRAVERARVAGADQVEVFVNHGRSTSVELQKNDLHTAATAEETAFGIRVFKGGSLGFVTVNDPSRLEEACAEALALARAAPPDPLNGLREPEPVLPLKEAPDRSIAALGVEDLVELARRVLDRIEGRDPRVMVDSGGLAAHAVRRALVTSTGIRLYEESASAGGHLMGMAVDGSDVGSFDHDGHEVRRRHDLERELLAAADRFVIKVLSGLGAKKGESFRGTAVLSPEVVRDFVVGNLISVLDGRAVRTGKSPLKEKLGERVASPLLDLLDDGRRADGTASAAFDREGTPTRPLPILEDGVLRNFFYDVFEARAAGQRPTGHARGGASQLPVIGPSNLVLRSGDQAFSKLCSSPERAVVVSRFSGSCNAVTGDFSGVVKGGFLMRRGDRMPLRETLIAGNLYELLNNVSGVSFETRCIDGRSWMPALRVEDISVTTG